MHTPHSRILFLLDNLGAGGAQRQLVELSRSFYSLGYKIIVLTYSNNLFYKEVLLKDGIDVYNLNEKRIFWRLIKVRKFIRNGGFETVVSFLGPPNFLNIFSAIPYRNWKVIVGERSANPAFLNYLKSRMIRMFYLFADIVISNSHSNIMLVRKINPFLPARKCKVIYNAVDLDKYKPLQHFRFRSHGVITIVVPASYRKLKNILNLIEAVNMLSPREKKELVIEWYGDKTPGVNPDEVLDEATALVEKYNLQSIIRLLPLNKEILFALQNADAIGLFSFFEGLPNAICEGMACGKPIIASDVSDNSRIVTNHVNGVLCIASDIRSITEALQYLLNTSPEELKKMGKTSREIAEHLFDKNVIVEQYLKLIE
jgi:glycosyltransferase involved in cell wall biosynthesis